MSVILCCFICFMGPPMPSVSCLSPCWVFVSASHSLNRRNWLFQPFVPYNRLWMPQPTPCKINSLYTSLCYSTHIWATFILTSLFHIYTRSYLFFPVPVTGILTLSSQSLSHVHMDYAHVTVHGDRRMNQDVNLWLERVSAKEKLPNNVLCDPHGKKWHYSESWLSTGRGKQGVVEDELSQSAGGEGYQETCPLTILFWWLKGDWNLNTSICCWNIFLWNPNLFHFT